jgi:uncharacterized protein
MAKTARELTREELVAYHPGHLLERDRKDPDVLRRREEAWRLAQMIAQMLRKRFQATRVLAFGSLARKDAFTLWSDIDLAVWGIPPEEYYAAAGTALDIGLENGIKVDVVDPDVCGRKFLSVIEEEGIEL